jgi:hypothetical protein
MPPAGIVMRHYIRSTPMFSISQLRQIPLRQRSRIAANSSEPHR